MRNLFKTVAFTAAGAAAMYYLDPERGHRRRMLVRDRLELVSQDASDYARMKSRLAAQRVKALAASAKASLSEATAFPTGESLAQRSRDEIDRLMSRSHALDMERAPLLEATRGTLLGTLFKAVALCAASAAAMYYLDPEMGRRRRALVRDKLDSVSHDASDFARSKGKRAADRVKGLVASVKAPLTGASKEAGSDHRLRARIRSQLGSLVSHPKAIEVEVTQDGQVRLSGHILARDQERLLSAVSAMPGVHGVDNRLSVHEQADGISELQGSGSSHQRSASRTRQMLPFVAVAAPLAVMMTKRRNARLMREADQPMH